MLQFVYKVTGYETGFSTNSGKAAPAEKEVEKRSRKKKQKKEARKKQAKKKKGTRKKRVKKEERSIRHGTNKNV